MKWNGWHGNPPIDLDPNNNLWDRALCMFIAFSPILLIIGMVLFYTTYCEKPVPHPPRSSPCQDEHQ